MAAAGSSKARNATVASCSQRNEPLFSEGLRAIASKSRAHAVPMRACIWPRPSRPIHRRLPRRANGFCSGAPLPRRPIGQYTWEDKGTAVLLVVPPLGPASQAASTAASAVVTPDSFALEVTTAGAVYRLECKPLFGTVDPRTSAAAVDPRTGRITLTLQKWFDEKPWLELIDPDPTAHPASKLALPEDAFLKKRPKAQ
eukprot:SAG22_NODE_31_length_27697_cov_7.384376_2_plen_199_part_00